MRNLQKILALVLALVMSVSLVTTAGAAFQDEADISASYKEAIDVLNGLEVFKGYNNGATFDPKGSITRAEVAAIIYRIVTGDVKDAQASIYSSYGQFTDVLDGSWYAGYVNYCANAGYIKGRGNKIFAPQDHVKGYEALAMILRAVGYDKNNEFTGSSWQVRTASTARERGILKNVNSSLLGEDATREMVAEILFQSIIIPTVNFNANTLSYTEKGAKETLGYESLKLEQIKGVVTANEYADLEDTDTLSDGKTRMLVNGSNYTLDYTSTLEDIGETRVAYIQGSKVLVLGGKDANNTIWETNSEVKSGDFKADKDFQSTTGLKRNDDTQEFLNFGTGTNWKSDWRIRYEFEVTADYFATTDVQTIINRAIRESGFSIPSSGYDPDKAVNATADKDGRYYIYTTRDNSESVTIEKNDDNSMWIVIYSRTFAKDTDITSLHQNNIEYIFDIADKKVDVTRQYERGEVYVGTTSTKDISDELSFKQFKDEYIKEDDEDLITENENGNWLKVIDNNLDGTADYVLKTIYTVAQVTRVKDSDITLDVKNINLTDGDSLNELNDEDVISSDTLEKDDVVYYAMIDGKAQTYKASYVTATIDKVNRNTLTATTTDGTEYVESGVHEHIESDAFESGVRSLAGKVSYDLYFDRGGYLAAFAKTDNSGDFVLITDAWYNKTKSADEYAVKAYIDGKIQVRDVTENGDLFISGDMGDVMNNGWKALKFLGGVNENNGALGRNGEKAALNARGGASTNQIKTTVASLSADGTLLPVDNSAVASRNDHYMIAVKNNVIPTDKYEARGTIYESTYLTNINDTAYNYENTRTTDVEVRALTDTIYYVVYEDNFEDIHVDQYTGYGDAPSISSDKIEDVYAVCTFNSYTSGVNEDRAIYTADVVVIECNDKYDGKSDIVFIYDDESVASNVKIDYVDMIDKDGNIKEDVAVNLKDSDVFVYDRAGYKKLVPGLYRMSLNGSADNEYIVRGPLTPKEIEDAKCFTTGFVRQTVTSSKQYVDIHPTYNIDGALGNSNRQLVNYAGYLLDNNGNVTNEQSIGTDANVVRYRVDNENFYTLSYGEISYNDGAAEMEKDDVSYVMTPKADARTDKERYDGFTADSRNYNWNRVLVRYDDNKIVYAISFANVIDQDDDQYVTSNNRWVNFDFAAWGGVAGYVSSTSDYITNQGAWGMVQPSKSAAAPVVTEVSIYGVPLTAGNPETRDYYQVKDYTGNAVVVKNLGDGWNSSYIPDAVPTEGGEFVVRSYDGTKVYTLIVNPARTDTALYRNGSPISTSNPLFDGDKDRDLTVGDYVKQFKVYGTDGKVLPDGSYTITWEILDAAKKNLYGQDNVYMQVQSVTATVTAEDGTTFKVYSWGNVPVNTDVDALVKGANDLVANATVDNLNEITNKVTELNGYLTSGKYNDVALTEADKIAIQGAIDALNAKKAELNKPEEPANVTVNTVNFEVKWNDANGNPAFAASDVTIDKTTLYDATTGKLTVKATDLTVNGWENFKFESVTATIGNSEMATGEMAATEDSWTLDLSDKTGDVSVNLAVVIKYAKKTGNDPVKPVDPTNPTEPTNPSEPVTPGEDKPSVTPAPGEDNDDFTDYDPSAPSRRARVRAGETTGDPYYVVWNIPQAKSFTLYGYNVIKIQLYKNGAPQTGTVTLPIADGQTVSYKPSEGNVLYIARVWVTEENYNSNNWSIDLYPEYDTTPAPGELGTLTLAVAEDGTVTVTGATTEANVTYYTAAESQASVWADWTTETAFTAPTTWTALEGNTVTGTGYVIAVEVTDGKVVAIGETRYEVTDTPAETYDVTIVDEAGLVTKVMNGETEETTTTGTFTVNNSDQLVLTVSKENVAATLKDSETPIAAINTDGVYTITIDAAGEYTVAETAKAPAVAVALDADSAKLLQLDKTEVLVGAETQIQISGKDDTHTFPATADDITVKYGTKSLTPKTDWTYDNKTGVITFTQFAIMSASTNKVVITAKANDVSPVNVTLEDIGDANVTLTHDDIHKGDTLTNFVVTITLPATGYTFKNDPTLFMLDATGEKNTDVAFTVDSWNKRTGTLTFSLVDAETEKVAKTVTGDIIIDAVEITNGVTINVYVNPTEPTGDATTTVKVPANELLKNVKFPAPIEKDTVVKEVKFLADASADAKTATDITSVTEITYGTTQISVSFPTAADTLKVVAGKTAKITISTVAKMVNLTGEITISEGGNLTFSDTTKTPATGSTRKYAISDTNPTALVNAWIDAKELEVTTLTNKYTLTAGIPDQATLLKNPGKWVLIADVGTKTVTAIGCAQIPENAQQLYSISVDMKNAEDSLEDVKATEYAKDSVVNTEISLVKKTGYDMFPETVTVTMGGKTVAQGSGWDYDSETGKITFTDLTITGNVVITPSAALKQVDKLTVTIEDKKLVVKPTLTDETEQYVLLQSWNEGDDDYWSADDGLASVLRDVTYVDGNDDYGIWNPISAFAEDPRLEDAKGGVLVVRTDDNGRIVAVGHAEYVAPEELANTVTVNYNGLMLKVTNAKGTTTGTSTNMAISVPMGKDADGNAETEVTFDISEVNGTSVKGVLYQAVETESKTAEVTLTAKENGGWTLTVSNVDASVEVTLKHTTEDVVGALLFDGDYTPSIGNDEKVFNGDSLKICATGFQTVESADKKITLIPTKSLTYQTVDFSKDAETPTDSDVLNALIDFWYGGKTAADNKEITGETAYNAIKTWLSEQITDEKVLKNIYFIAVPYGDTTNPDLLILIVNPFGKGAASVDDVSFDLSLVNKAIQADVAEDETETTSDSSQTPDTSDDDSEGDESQQDSTSGNDDQSTEDSGSKTEDEENSQSDDEA